MKNTSPGCSSISKSKIFPPKTYKNWMSAHRLIYIEIKKEKDGEIPVYIGEVIGKTIL